MPLLTAPESVTGNYWGRPVELPGLPIFNYDSRDYIVTDLDGWESTAKPDAVFVRNGGGAGALASGSWLSQENYLTISGMITGSYAVQAGLRRLLLAAVPQNIDTAITVYGWPGEEDLQAFVRLYDRPEFTRGPDLIEFVLPLIQLDPYKYATESLTGTMGVFTAEDWFQLYTLSGSDWVETYALSGSNWVDVYQQAEASGPYPDSLLIESPGDATSMRIVFTITGPLIAGDWWLLNETTGDRVWVEAGVADTQELVIDSLAGTAVLSGADATHLVYGDFLSLAPGSNLFRLQSGTASSAFATVTALAAYL